MEDQGMAQYRSSSVGTSVGSAGGGAGSMLLLGLVAVGGYFLFTAFLMPAFAVAVEVYAAAVAVPATFTQQEWTNLAWDALWGVVAGLLVGLIRLWRRGEVLEQAADTAASADTVSAARIGLWGLVVHVLVGAMSGGVGGLLGLVSPLQLADGSTFLADHSFLPAVNLLLGAGFFNAGGAPPAGGDVNFILVVLVLLIVLATIVLALVATTGLAWWVNVLASGAARGGGSVIGSSLLLALTGRRKGAQSRGWFGAALAMGIVTGMWTGLINALVVVACLYAVRERVQSALGAGPSLAEWSPPGGHAIPGGGEVAFQPDGQALVVSGEHVICWDLTTGEQSWQSWSGASALAFSPDGQILAAIDRYGRYRRFDPASGNPTEPAANDPYNSSGLAFLADGHTVVSRDGKDSLRLRDAGEETAPRTLTSPVSGYGQRLTAALRAPVVAAVFEHSVVLWDADSGRVLATLAQEATVFGLALSPDGRTVAVGDGRRLKLWDVATGKLLRTLAGHGEQVGPVAFSPDGKLLASAAGGEVRLWDAATGRGLHCAGCGSGINSLVFSPDGRLLATATSEAVKLWEVR
jgi:hypothetical protein